MLLMPYGPVMAYASSNLEKNPSTRLHLDSSKSFRIPSNSINLRTLLLTSSMQRALSLLLVIVVLRQFLISANLLNDLSPVPLVTITLKYIRRATLTLGKVSESHSSWSNTACLDGVTHDLRLAKAANWTISLTSTDRLLRLKSRWNARIVYIIFIWNV